VEHLKNPLRNGFFRISIFPREMSSTIQAPLYIPHPARNASVVSGGAEILHPDASFRDHNVSLDEENTMTRKKVETITQCKLPTYQAAAVVVGWLCRNFPFVTWI
jgi:hypothetical protein